MIRLLVSAQDVPEALQAMQAGADLVDLKDPAAGALGGLPLERIVRIAAALRGARSRTLVSATIGDLAAHERAQIVRRVAAVAACGVDLVKVGIAPAQPAVVSALLDALAACEAQVVPVFIADEGIDAAAVEAALATRAFPALMLDTAGKGGGSLVERVPGGELRRFVKRVRAAGAWAGLAGALREADLPALQAIAPDFAGFRSAVASGSRAGPLDPERVRQLAALLRADQPLRAARPA